MNMPWDADVEIMFKEIAARLKCNYSKRYAPGGAVFMLITKSSSFQFSTFLERNGKLKILMFTSYTKTPMDFGNYTKEELKDKAQKEIIAKLIQLSK